MATNFSVIISSGQHFGDEDTHVGEFVGPTKDFPFDCPSVDPGETAFMMFQSRDVSHERNVFQVNGVDVVAGLPAVPGSGQWVGNIVLIETGHQLKEAGNELHVESRNEGGGGGDNLDDFLIDSVVIVYKTREGLIETFLEEVTRRVAHR